MIDVRRSLVQVETIYHEFGPRPAKPQVRGAICSVITNPYAGRYEPNILPMMEALNPLGVDMARRLLAAIGVPAEGIEGYGKGAIVGSAGELEHGALWHVPGGWGMREVLGWKDGKAGANAKAIVPSTKKVGAPGARLEDRPVAGALEATARRRPDNGAAEVRAAACEAEERLGVEPDGDHLRAVRRDDRARLADAGHVAARQHDASGVSRRRFRRPPLPDDDRDRRGAGGAQETATVEPALARGGDRERVLRVQHRHSSRSRSARARGARSTGATARASVGGGTMRWFRVRTVSAPKTKRSSGCAWRRSSTSARVP